MNSLRFQNQTRWMVTVILLFALSISNAWGDSNYSWTAAVADFGTTASPNTSLSSKGSPAISWTAAYTWSKNKYIGTALDNNSRGVQIGASPSSGNNRHVTQLVLSTSGISGTISNVTIETAGASSTNANVGVVVGSTTFKCNNNNTASLTASNASYSFSGSASGTITITWNQTSAKALYIKSVSITYSTGSTKTLVLLGIGFWVG